MKRFSQIALLSIVVTISILALMPLVSLAETKDISITCNVTGESGYKDMATCQKACIKNGLSGVCSSSLIITPDYINRLIQKYTVWFMVVVGSIAVIIIVWAGLQYIISRGDETKMKTARKMIIYAFIGLAITLLAGGAMWTITQFLDVSTTTQ